MLERLLGNPLTSYQNTDPLKPTIRILSLIFFSFSSTTTSNMGGTNWLSEMTRYSGIIERSTVTVPNEMEEEIKFIYSEKATKFCEISTNYLTDST